MNRADASLRQVTSKDNPSFRRLERIRKAPQRAEPPVLFLEGLRLCADAIRSGVPIIQVVLSQEGFRRAEIAALLPLIEASEETLVLSDHLFERLAATEEPQGIALICAQPLRTPDRLAPDARGLYLVLEGVSDPGNVGTLVRTADAFAFAAVLVMPQTASPFSDKAVRSAMGSCLHIPIVTFDSIDGLKNWLNRASLALYTADLQGIPLDQAPFDAPGALLIGNEAHGVSAAARQACDRIVTIPMPGQAESLNAAAAGAVLCYALRAAFPLGT